MPAVSALRDDARAIWLAAVKAVDPFRLVQTALSDSTGDISRAIAAARRVLIIGGGKAGTAMAAAVEEQLATSLDQLDGWINVPAGTDRPLRRIHLHPARPAGSNHPTEAGVDGVRAMLDRIEQLKPGDLVLCLLSGGGSALLPAPIEGVSLADKQQTNRLLHACGATITEMNCVRKHLSAVKGGRLAQRVAARGCPLVSLILSDVVGDPLDVIASGPTAIDPTTFAEAVQVLDRYDLRNTVPAAVLAYLARGRAGDVPETLKTAPPGTTNVIVGSNRLALDAAHREATNRGYRVLDLGAFLEGETSQVALTHAGIVRSIQRDGQPLAPPVCLLSGGETTVTLPAHPGRGGRNQEFVLATLASLVGDRMHGVCVLSGGTDGEDGPTDAAGALADAGTVDRAASAGCAVADHLVRHDAYPFFAAAGDLLLTGPTGTNVADVRVVLIGSRD